MGGRISVQVSTLFGLGDNIKTALFIRCDCRVDRRGEGLYFFFRA